eukprot:SAG22_NODE_3721_length_1559_cov_1.507534_2_plen_161_part_01
MRFVPHLAARQDAGQMAEEIKRPERNLPISIFGGVGLACLIYLLCNVSYLLVLDADAVVASPAVAAEHVNTAAAALLPASAVPLMSGAVALLVALSAVGGTNISVMAGGRYLFAMARGGEAPVVLARLSRYHTPYVALVAQSAAAIGLLLLPGAGLSGLVS